MTLIDPVLLKARLADQAGRFDLVALDECDSTSSELMRRAARGAPAGTVLVADRQTAGRGRRGRNWLSSPAGSLTFSLYWRFPGAAAALAGLSLAVGVALAQALEGLGAQGLRLKWPNDLLLVSGDDFAKLAGILVELSSDRRGTQVFIGIGINLSAPAEDLGQPAAGLDQAMPGPVDRHAVLSAILGALARELDDFAVNGFAAQKSAWQARHAWQDRRVNIIDEQRPLSGICRGVAADGSLLLLTANGEERILAGDVSLRPA